MHVADMLVEEIYFASRLGQQLLETSGFGLDGVIYVFIVDDTLVINCRDQETIERFGESLADLQRTIDHFRFAIKTIVVELNSQTLYEW